MALSTSTSVQGHRVKVFLSPIDLSPWSLTISSPYLLWQKQQKCRLEREQRCKTSRNCDNSPKQLWSTVIGVDSGLKDRVLGGTLWRPQCHFSQRHPAWNVVKSKSHDNIHIYSTWTMKYYHVLRLADMPISVVFVLRVFSTVQSLLIGFYLEFRWRPILAEF
jgi:hypothetical protein